MLVYRRPRASRKGVAPLLTGKNIKNERQPIPLAPEPEELKKNELKERRSKVKG
jgi:hypothetical protein